MLKKEKAESKEKKRKGLSVMKGEWKEE